MVISIGILPTELHPSSGFYSTMYFPIQSFPLQFFHFAIRTGQCALDATPEAVLPKIDLKSDAPLIPIKIEVYILLLSILHYFSNYRILGYYGICLKINIDLTCSISNFIREGLRYLRIITAE